MKRVAVPERHQYVLQCRGSDSLYTNCETGLTILANLERDLPQAQSVSHDGNRTEAHRSRSDDGAEQQPKNGINHTRRHARCS